MAARRWRTSIDQSRLAVTSGGVFLGLGFARNLHTVDEIIELLQSGSISGTIFVGVLVNDSGAPGLKAFDGTEDKRTPKPGRTRRRQR